MEFGKLPCSALPQVDFRLPPDPPVTTDALRAAPASGPTAFFVGGSRLGRKEWVGKIYPKGTRDRDYLHHYSRLVNTIESNSFYYHLPAPEQIRKWTEATPPGFRFCPKFPQTVTHYKRLQHVEPETDAFLEAIHGFGDRLGPVFAMPNPQMGPATWPVIERFLSSLPTDIELFLELRHPDFFRNGLPSEVTRYLSAQGRGLVITDTAGRRDCVHMALTVPHCFLRFVGNALHESDYRRIDDWVERLAEWKRQGLRSCSFFVHQPDELQAFSLIRYVTERLNEQAGAGLEVPEFVRQDSEQGNLF